VVQAMTRARRLLFITGAGMSADSGLPTYRGCDGLYRAQETTAHGIPIEQALSGPMLRARPEITWHYLLELERSTRDALPHRGHEVLAEMQDYFDAIWVLTQNVDGLHQRAGSRNVLEIHGNLHGLECICCGYQTAVPGYAGIDVPPRCPTCEGVLRPRVVLFEEELPADTLNRLWAEVDAGFDLIFSVGTSSLFDYVVEPVRLGRRMGIPTVEINPDPTRISSLASHRVSAGAAEALDAVWEEYLTWWPRT
jgi:NAD-dependent deacetylase